MREARLRPEFADLYPTLTPGEWQPAARVAEVVLARLLLLEISDAPLGERVLDEKHFDFRGDSPNAAPHRPLTSRAGDGGGALEDQRYPIGRFEFDGKASPELREHWIAEIAAAPGALRAAVVRLTPQQLDTPYRQQGWTVRQVVHHIPDSHLNAYVRIKLALTEEEPVIKPYEEARWAELPDVRATPIETSLTLLECLHRRWVLLLRELKPADFARRFRHPEHGRSMGLDEAIAMYAWHGRHHVAQIVSLRRRMGWS